MKRSLILLLAAVMLVPFGSCGGDDSATRPRRQTVSNPYFEPVTGIYSEAQDVIIRCDTAGSRIFYTTDGSEPDTNSTEFIFQTVITVCGTTALRARAYQQDMNPSEVVDAQYTIIPGLVAFYPFDGNADDMSGNDHHGTVHGAVPASDRFGNPGAAYHFDGTGAYIELPNESAFDFTEYTISFWIHITTLPEVTAPPAPGFYCVVSKSDFNLGNYTIRLSRAADAGHCNLSCAHRTSLGNWSTTCFHSIHPNQYYHITVTMSDQIRCYYNGAHVFTTTSMAEAIQSDGNVLIGRFYSDTNPWYFNGIIDDVRFYNRALSASEIEDLYQAES